MGHEKKDAPLVQDKDTLLRRLTPGKDLVLAVTTAVSTLQTHEVAVGEQSTADGSVRVLSSDTTETSTVPATRAAVGLQEVRVHVELAEAVRGGSGLL